MIFKWDYALEILPTILRGLRITILATFTGFAVAAIVGLLFALARRSHVKIISWPVGQLIDFIRTTPLIVQLYFLFFILPRYGINLSPFLTGVIGIGLHYSAYTSEVYRAGIEAVQRGQWEAAIALNFSHIYTWIDIVLPQAIPPMIPALGNYLIAMFKDTPQLAAITFVEVLLTAKIIASHSFRYTEPYTIVGILFFLLSYPSSLFIQKLEKRFGQSKI